MAETTAIAWTDATVNFWHGCQKVSEGCKYCYMFRDKARYNQDGSQVVKTKPSTINRILKELRIKSENLRLANVGAGKEVFPPVKIFTCSWSDFFIEQADEWREEAWNIIREHPQFIWQILTKRPERILQSLPPDWGEGWDNVWLGVSAENQDRWEERVPVLLSVPAKVRFVSAEPLLGPVQFLSYCNSCKAFLRSKSPTCGTCFSLTSLPDWVIIGGESGNDSGPWKYRECKVDWIADLADDCLLTGVPVFVKQTGTEIAKLRGYKDRAGANPEEWPSFLNVQQFPK